VSNIYVQILLSESQSIPTFFSHPRHNETHPTTVMAMVTRVPFVAAATTPLSSSSSSFLQSLTWWNRESVAKGVGTRISVVAAKITVLVTGAGGRTGVVFSFYTLIGFVYVKKTSI